MEDMPWCIIFQSPHSLNYCVIAQSFSANQQIKPKEGEEDKSHEDITCNMINLCDNGDESKIEVSNQRSMYELYHQ